MDREDRVKDRDRDRDSHRDGVRDRARDRDRERKRERDRDGDSNQRDGDRDQNRQRIIDVEREKESLRDEAGRKRKRSEERAQPEEVREAETKAKEATASAEEPATKKSKWAPIGHRPDIKAEEEEMKELKKALSARKSGEVSRGSRQGDREKIIEEMQRDAKAHREEEMERMRLAKEEEEAEKSGQTQRGIDDRPAFLNDTNRSVYVEHEQSLADNLHRRRHYRQRIRD